MSDYSPFVDAVSRRFAELSKHELFVVDPGERDLFAEYLAAFPPGTNPLFRTRTEHDCQTCRQFVRNLGHVVAIVDGEVETVWGRLGQLPEPYATVGDRLGLLVRELPIKSVFRTTEGRFGVAHNYDKVTNDKYVHMHGEIAARHKCSDPGAKRSDLESAAQVFRRGLDELTLAALDQVVELIEANTLYRGEEHGGAVIEFRHLKQRYDAAANKNVFVWANLDNRAVRFRNTVIGTLVVDLSAGVELEQAVKSFEAKVAPQNYKRPTALITPRMIEDAVKTIADLGLEGALKRRYAKLSDISVNNVLWVDNQVRGQMRDGLAGLLAAEVKAPEVKIKDATEVTIDTFLGEILPKAKRVECLVENRHLGNFVSLTAPVEAGEGKLFKWNNDFAWSYDGELADSIKQRVKKAGGNVNAALRVSLGWFNFDDLDLHCDFGGRHIYYGNRAGVLDVDMNANVGTSREAVENLAFDNIGGNGRCRVWVNQFWKRESIDLGFSLEYEHDGVVRSFRYEKGLAHHEDVPCLDLLIKNGKVVEVMVAPGLKEGSSSQDRWGVKTETLVPVTTILNSPNHWDGQGVGNRHTFFILAGCQNPDGTRGIYNEFLRGDLDRHRKVFEILGAKTKCLPAAEQLSGVGFSSTRQDTVSVVVDRRAFTVKF